MTADQQVAKERTSSQAQPSQEAREEGDLLKRAIHHAKAEHFTEEAQELWRRVSQQARKPSVGATIAGAAVLAAGAIWGASEAAIAALAAYLVFRMLRKRGSSGDARAPAETEHDGQASAEAT
jgi:hypothetical protein